MKRVILLFFAFCLISGFSSAYAGKSTMKQQTIPSKKHAISTPAAIKKQVSNQPDQLDSQVQQWVHTLSKQKEFLSWKEATWSSLPLGPGTHQWVIHLKNKDQDVGYLIVSATEDGGYTLSEYGIGTKPLFSMNTLYHSLVQHELISSKYPLYFDGLQAFWKVTLANGETHFIDAKNGEDLPITATLVASLSSFQTKKESNGKNSALIESNISPAFDPFDELNWLGNTDSPLSISHFSNLSQALKQNRVVYVADLFHHTYIAPFAVVGYHVWKHGEPYVLVEDQGERYIPFSVLLAHGVFYKQ